MEQFLSASSQDSNWEYLINDCLNQIGEIPPESTLGFIYITTHLAIDMQDILHHLEINTPVRHWVGTVGLGISAGKQEYYDKPALTLMITDIPEEDFRVFSIQNDITSIRARHGDWCSEHTHFSAIVHGDPRTPVTPVLISQLGGYFDHIFMTGGLSSAIDEYPQIADKVTENGISGVLFSDKVKIATMVSQGCTPIGKKHVVTEGSRNVISGLDHRPALEVFKDDIGEILARDLNRVGGYIFIGLPIPGSDTGDYTVRNLLAIDTEHQQLVVGEYVEEGKPVLFCRRDGKSAWEDFRIKLENLKQRIHSPIKGGLYFSCLGRGRELFGENSEEVRFIHEILGDFPLAGFFANGEIANNQLYGYTGVLTLFF